VYTVRRTRSVVSWNARSVRKFPGMMKIFLVCLEGGGDYKMLWFRHKCPDKRLMPEGGREGEKQRGEEGSKEGRKEGGKEGRREGQREEGRTS
jgi:hypothetical protein